MAEARPRGRVIQYVCKAALGETHEHSSGLRWGLALEYGYIIIELQLTFKNFDSKSNARFDIWQVEQKGGGIFVLV